MVFASSTFLFIVFPIFFVIFYLLRNQIKLQNIWTLIASLLIYAWGGVYFCLLLIASIIFNFFLTIWMEKQLDKSKKKALFIFIIVIDVLLLILFKYSYFLACGIKNLLEVFSINISVEAVAKIPLPIGISFYTFQILSYVIDVYLGKVKAQKNLINLGLYISLFPQLIAGPIVRYIDIEREINQREVTLENTYVGLKRFIIGLSKKLILANALGTIADNMFAVSGYGDWKLAWLGIISYSLQIYYDFSAYSDMAIGMGRMMGFHFFENFEYPYISLSIKEFWRRWHISLSSWFRDYVYIPLGGNRNGHTYRNLFIVFLITGLWHGASWTFVLWGIWHGVFLILERGKWGNILNKLPKIVKRFYTLFIVAIGWVFFRADSIPAALMYIKNMFSVNAVGGMHFHYWLSNWNILVLLFGIICCYPLKELPIIKRLQERKTMVVVTDIVLCVVYVAALVFMSGTEFNPFIYFKF